MTEYESQIQQRESRINCMRISRALYEYISGEFAGAERPTVQRLAQMLHYMPEQLCTDVKDLYRFITDIDGETWGTLSRITARYNAEVDATRRAGELDFMPDQHSQADMLRIIIAEYALKHYPETLQEDEEPD